MYLNIKDYQASLNGINLQSSENTRVNRQMGTPEAGVTGGSGDSDIRQFLTPILKNQIPIIQGMNGLQSGFIAINLNTVKPPEGTPIITQRCGPSNWNQQYTSPSGTSIDVPKPNPCGT
jgi:hypothetical protein